MYGGKWLRLTNHQQNKQKLNTKRSKTTTTTTPAMDTWQVKGWPSSIKCKQNRQQNTYVIYMYIYIYVMLHIAITTTTNRKEKHCKPKILVVLNANILCAHLICSARNCWCCHCYGSTRSAAKTQKISCRLRLCRKCNNNYNNTTSRYHLQSISFSNSNNNINNNNNMN